MSVRKTNKAPESGVFEDVKKHNYTANHSDKPTKHETEVQHCISS